MTVLNAIYLAFFFFCGRLCVNFGVYAFLGGVMRELATLWSFGEIYACIAGFMRF